MTETDGKPGGRARHLRDTVQVPGGKALLGTARPVLPADGEGPARTRRVVHV